MTLSNSWVFLEADSKEDSLCKKFKSRDGFECTDVGWVSQMTPFIREFSKPGDKVLDPFAGLGTTLMAVKKENRSGWGIEIEPERVRLIEERWRKQEFRHSELTISCGDCLSTLKKFKQENNVQKIDLCITSVPYFGSSWHGSSGNHQLYACKNYFEYLNYFRELALILRSIVKDDGYLIFMAENIRCSDGGMLPLAWDIGKIMSTYFRMYDERIILYRKENKPQIGSSLQTNRAHEYALIFRNEKNNVVVSDGNQFLLDLIDINHRFIIYGSFAEVIKGCQQTAGDIDLVLVDDKESKARTLRNLVNQGFDIYCGEKLIHRELLSNETEEDLKERFYRCFTEKKFRQLDLVFLDEEQYSKINTHHSDNDLLSRVVKEPITINENWEVTQNSM